jgi:hypothetical protein
MSDQFLAMMKDLDIRGPQAEAMLKFPPEKMSLLVDQWLSTKKYKKSSIPSLFQSSSSSILETDSDTVEQEFLLVCSELNIQGKAKKSLLKRLNTKQKHAIVVRHREVTKKKVKSSVSITLPQAIKVLSFLI